MDGAPSASRPTPPVERDDLPRARAPWGDGFALKETPDDFEVEEIPAYPATGEGPHQWLWIEKRGVATLQLVNRLAAGLGISPRAIGYAGLKDAAAVTRQAMTLPGDVGAIPEELQQRLGMRVLEAKLTRNKIKIGHLRGNRFGIRVRGVPADVVDDLRINLEFMQAHGAPNGFGEQRFGTEGDGVEQGLALLRADDPRRAVKRTRKGLGRLFVGAVQSEVFNRVLAGRVARYGAASIGELQAGDVAWLHRNGACFSIDSDEGAATEAPRAAAFEISPTGPMPGPKTKPTGGAVGEIERDALAALGLGTDAFAALGTKLAQGVRRPLRVPVGDPNAVPVEGGVRLSFTLPRGSYATVVVRQLFTGMGWYR